MSKKKSTDKVIITTGQMIMVVVYILYSTYKNYYGSATILQLDPFILLLVEVSQFVIAMFIGKQIGGKLTDHLQEQIGILVNPEINDNQRIALMETHIQWELRDLNKLYDKKYNKFRGHMEKKGYEDITIKFKIDCLHCKAKNEVGSIYCTKCGKPIDEIPKKPEPPKPDVPKVETPPVEPPVA